MIPTTIWGGLGEGVLPCRLPRWIRRKPRRSNGLGVHTAYCCYLTEL